ncbi:type-F conjugative transfer system mating-pair stabilization protein TraN [Serratia marcescens]|nr:type-F conjugative transfer system mating-pair stabilization protein TraN [Serratia marcescens]
MTLLVKSLPGLLATHALVLGTFIFAVGDCRAEGDDVFQTGSEFAKQVAGQGSDTLQNTNPANVLPNYTDNPKEKGYYGGVTAGDAGQLKSDGTTAWGTTEVGKAVNESFLNNPKEPISHDAPFIQAGKEIEGKAESIVGKTGPDCKAELVTRSTFTNYVCERDINDTRDCSREASIGLRDDYAETEAVESGSGRQRYTYPVKTTGRVTWAKLVIENIPLSSSMCNHVRTGSDSKCPEFTVPTVTFLGRTQAVTVVQMPQNYKDGKARVEIELGGLDMGVTQGQGIFGQVNYRYFRFQNHSGHGDRWETAHPQSGELTGGQATIWLRNKATRLTQVPIQVWKESCPFSKEGGALLSTRCFSGPETRETWINGRKYTLFSQCWAYVDTYTVPVNDAGSCKTYMDNPACTLANRQCAFNSEDGVCVHENVTYSCETRTTGEVMICGGQLYCLDGECDKTQKGTQGNDFAHAVSELAAVAAAGKDVAALNGIDVRAFTGKGQSCRKAFVGFSDCCKDSGWGNSVGLAHCDSEEKALGKAKENKLTVSVGEYCSKKVLGVCLQKKRSYCQFDSKLAQIVQQQGRAWQLGIGFGGAKSPDCRGITVDELQRINFDQLDFANFYEDLMKNQKVPEDAALLEKVKQQIAERMKEAGK